MTAASDPSSSDTGPAADATVANTDRTNSGENSGENSGDTTKADRAGAERNAEQNAQQNAEKNAEKNAVQNAEQNAEQKAEQRTDVPMIDLTIADKAARRSRAGGVWSLGHLAVCWATLLAAGVLLGIVGALVVGSRAVWGAAIGTLIVGAFFTVSAVVIAQAGQRNPKLVLPAALGTYLIKIVALGFVLVMIPRDGAVDTRWMAGAVGLGLFCWLGAHMRYVWTSKIFYTDPG